MENKEFYFDINNSDLQGFVFNCIRDYLDAMTKNYNKKVYGNPAEIFLVIHGEYIENNMVIQDDVIKIMADSKDPSVIWVRCFEHNLPCGVFAYQYIMGVLLDGLKYFSNL